MHRWYCRRILHGLFRHRMGLAVLPEYEARGIGSRLLTPVVEWLRLCGQHRLWLAASPNPKVRGYGF